MFAELKSKIKSFLLNRGYNLIRIDAYNKKINYYREVLVEIQKYKKEEKIDSIVFSKDRALQLHAFLLSYMQQVNHYGTMYILYKTSNEKHKKSYEELQQIFSSELFVFIEETEFRSQLINILRCSKAKTIGLFVDDMIFIRPVDYVEILKISTLDHVVALSRGKDMTYSVVLDKKIDLPTFTKFSNEMLSFNWNQYDDFTDWTFPLGVSGYFYGRDELFVMLNQLSFKAPNTLEASMFSFNDFFIARKGICYETISCCCIHANMVQTETFNPILGDFSIDDLLKKWEEGLMIDINQFYGKLGNDVQVKKYSFTKR